MAGLISDIVGGNVDSDLDKLVAKLAAVEKELDVINGKAISIKVDLQGVGTLSELTNLYKQQDEILTKLRGTSAQYVDTYKMATEAIKQHNGQTQKVVAVSDKIAATLLKEAKAREVNVRTAEKEAALSERVSRQKEKEAQSVEKAAAAKQKAAEREIADYNRGAAAAQRHADMTEKQRQRAEAASQKYQAALQKETQAIADKLAKETAALQVADNAYIVLRNEYNKQSTALKGMIIQYGEADAAVLKMKVNVDAMYASLLRAEQAVGQHQRKVGQYQNATLALSQIIREAPAFTYSVTTGLMGIGNNIPILLDQFKLLRAEVGSTGKALKILGASLFGFTNLVSLGLTVLTLYTSGLIKFGSASDEAAKKMRELEQASKANAESEYANAQTLMSIAKDVNQSYDIRIRAIEDLQSKYPDYLGHLSREAILAGDVADAMERLNKALLNKALYEASIDKVGEMAKKYIDLNDQLRDAEVKLERLKKATVTPTLSEKEKAEERGINQANVIAARGQIKVIQKELSDTMKEMKRYQDEANAFGAKAAPLIVGQLKKTSAGGAGSAKKDTISDDLAAAKSDYELQLMLNQQKFVNSRDTDMAAQKLKDDNLKATTEYGERYIMIVEDFNNKHLLTENEHIKLINEANKILLEGQIKAKEAGDKIEEERLKKSIEANKKLIAYIESLSKQRQELEKINREIDNIQDKAASRKEYAESFAPYLEGFGFNTAFGQQVKQKNIDIEGQRDKVDLAREDWANEGAKGSKGNPLELLKLQTKAQQEKKNLDQMEAEREEMYNQKMIEGKKELARKTVELAKTAFDAMKQIQDNAFAAEQRQLDIKMQSVQLSSQQQMRAIDATTNFQIEKDNQKAKLAAETAAKENEIRQQSNNLNLRKAVADKQAAEARIIAETASAIIQTVAAYASIPGGFVIAAGLSAIIAAMGAAQYAAVSSTPLPQYEKGGTTNTSHFIAGEKGAELGITPSGQAVMFDKPGVYSAPLGTKIKTADQTKKIIEYASKSIGYNYATMSETNSPNQMTDKRIVEELQDMRHDLVKAALMTKTIRNTIAIKGNNNLQRPIYH